MESNVIAPSIKANDDALDDYLEKRMFVALGLLGLAVAAILVVPVIDDNIVADMLLFVVNLVCTVRLCTFNRRINKRESLYL